MNIPLAFPPNLYFPNTGGQMLFPTELIYNRRHNNGGMILPYLLGSFGSVPRGSGFFDVLKKEGLDIGKRLLKQVGKEALDLGSKYLGSKDEPAPSGSGVRRKRKATKRKRKGGAGPRSAKKLREALLL